eukprot:TRINITY_DN12727_c5_g1_i1.p1 TRINITY_DN12727_c5_g1~~TRINITY_DN12727_c5_g1_i1.p1  ORF type:complete len:488 (+),score=166.37 TRINITY_DN12727_c5_g1_i1:84-1547(+)
MSQQGSPKAAAADDLPFVHRGEGCLAHQAGLAQVHEALAPARAVTHPEPAAPSPRHADPAAPAAAAAAAVDDDDDESDSEEEQVLDPQLVSMLQDGDMLKQLQEQGLVHVMDGDDIGDLDDDDDVSQAPAKEVVETASLCFKAHSKPVHCVALCPTDPTVAVSGGEDDMAYLWKVGDVAAPGAAAELQPTVELKGHSDTVVAAAFSADGQFVATGGMDGRVIIWKTADGSTVATTEDLGDSVNYLFWHPRGNMLFAGSADSQSAMWNDRGVCLQLFTGHLGEVTCGCLTQDGKLLVTGSEDTSVRVFAPKTAEVVAQYSSRSKGTHELPSDAVRSLCPHGRNKDIVLAGFDNGDIALLSIPQARVLQMLQCDHSQAVEAMAFSPAVPYFASCCADGTLTVWTVDGCKIRHQVKSEDGFITLAWHQSDLYTTDTEGVVKRWDGRGGAEPTAAWTGHTDAALCMAVHPEARWVVTGSDDCSLRLFACAK